jgi:hypothetical protein
MKNSNDIIGNRTRDLPACSAVPQPTTPPRAPPTNMRHFYCYSRRYTQLLLSFKGCNNMTFRKCQGYLNMKYTDQLDAQILVIDLQSLFS